jgi:hypothetical protein
MAQRKSTKLSGNYASGISFPFRGDGDGGLAVTEGDEYIYNMVLGVVSPNDSDNAFEDLGGTEEMIFENPDDPAWRAAVRNRIRRQFQVLDRENLARLSSLKFLGTNEDGEYTIKIEYINLESTKKEDVDVTVNSAGEIVGIRQSG